MKYFIILQKESQQSQPIVDVTGQQARVQESRLFAALLESGWGVKVNELQVKSLEGIDVFFPISITPFAGEKTYEIPIKIEHTTPLTRFGDVERPLIFPTWLERVGSDVHEDREYLISFQGFPNARRVDCILDFIDSNFGYLNRLKRWFLSTASRLRNQEIRAKTLNFLFSKFCPSDQFLISWTTGGRKLMNKVVDKEYWKTLYRSRMVYCPGGDFGWSYRFYEATLAGAIPVIENKTPDSFAEQFQTVLSVQEVIGMEKSRITEITIQNRMISRLLLTAADDLKPSRFVGQ